LLDRGTMLAGATDLNATAREPSALIGTRTAADHGIEDGDMVAVEGAGRRLELRAAVRGDVVDGTVVLPANSTTPPANDLVAATGEAHVTLSRVAGAADSASSVAEEVA